MLALIRFMLRVTSVVAPPLAVWWVYRTWFRAPRFKEPKREARWRNSARSESIQSDYGRMQLFHWGEQGRPVVMLVHGWSGRGAQLGAFAAPLVEAGYHVIAFDAPAHGSSDGKWTTLFRIAEVQKRIIDLYGMPHAIVSHSFGCLVTAYSVRHYSLPIKNLIMISSPTTVDYLIDKFVKTLRIPNHIRDAFIRRFKAEYGEDLYEQVAADRNLQSYQERLLIIHDKNDRDVKWQCSELLKQARPDAKVVYTEHLGHRRILRDKAVIKLLLAFIQGS